MESLVPIPDVFSLTIAECNSEGILAYATRKSVALVNVNTFPPLFQEFLEHRFRVSALCFSKGRNPNILVSGCDDGSIHVWDITHSQGPTISFENPKVEKQIITNLLVLEEQNYKPELKIYAVEWKCGSDNIMFSSDERSFVIEWNVTTQASRIFRTKSKNSILALASCPNDPNLLATGHKSGDITILDVSTNFTKYQLRAHTDNVFHVQWSPHSADQLLSTSKDNSLLVWSLEKEDVIHTFSSISVVRGGSLSAIFSAIWHPRNPDMIICSSQQFVGTWDLSSSEKPKVRAYDGRSGMRHVKPVAHLSLHNLHENIVFSISMDRLILFWDIDERRSVYQLATIGGSVYDLSFSPAAFGRLGIAAGDANIRVWSVASSSTSPTQWFYVGTRSKVTTLAWHPEREHIIAFGTDDGRVGFIDISLRKTINICGNLHRSKVYKLSWGPCHLKKPEKHGNTLYLYSCGDGPIFIHTFSKEQEAAVDFDEIRPRPTSEDENVGSIRHTEVSWKPDFTCLAVGNSDGCIEIYHGSTFVLMARLHAQKKLIQKLQWHPTFTSLSSSPSTLRSWLACASYETSIHVYDLTNVIANPDGAPVTEMFDCTKELCGHNNKVSSIAWSPHLEGRLASASCDNTAQVWDVISGESIANFRGHRAKLYAIAWNVCDPDVLFTGGDDFLVLQWRVSQQLHTKPPSKGQRVRGVKKKQPDYSECLKTMEETKESGSLENGDLQENGSSVDDMNGNTNAEKSVPDVEPRVDAEDDDSPDLVEHDETEKLDSKMSSEEAWKQQRAGWQLWQKKTKNQNIMPVFGQLSRKNKASELQDCMILAKKFSNIDEKNESVPDVLFEEIESSHLAFFGGQVAVHQWLNVEAAYHRDAGNVCYAYELEIWKGNTGAALQEAAERGNLNDFLVSLAPSVSHSLWIEMCERYANQLIQEKSFQKAATYLLSCGKVYEAIDLLKNKFLFRDAVAIAKLRLPSSDPVIKEVISAWCEKLIFDKHFIPAAQWFIALKEPLKAAGLFIEQDAQQLQLATYICQENGHLSKAKEYAMLCLKKSLLNKKWDIAKEMIDKMQPYMNEYRALVAVHEALVNNIEVLQNETGDLYGITEKVFHNYYPKTPVVIWRSYLVREQNFLAHVFHLLLSHSLVPTKQEKLLEDIHAISLLKERPGESHHDPNQAMRYVSIDLVLFYLTLLLEKEEKFADAARYLNSVFRNCVGANYRDLLNCLCLFSFPFDVTFNASDLEVDLQVVGASNNDLIYQFFMWLNDRIEEQRLLSPVLFSGQSDFEASPRMAAISTSIDYINMKLSAITSVESILAYFLVNFVVQLGLLICQKNFHAKCYYKMQVESGNLPAEVNNIPQKSICSESDVKELATEGASSSDADVPETVAPTDDVTNVPETVAPTDDVTHVPETVAPTDDDTHVPETVAPTDDTHVPETVAPDDDDTHFPETVAPTDDDTHVPETVAPTDDDTHVPETVAPTDDDTLKDVDLILNDLLAETEKKIEFLRQQHTSLNEAVDVVCDKTPTTGFSMLSSENADLSDQPSVNASSVDLGSDTSSGDHLNGFGSKEDCGRNQNAKLSTPSGDVPPEECHFPEEAKYQTSALKTVLESPHAQCLHNLKFYFYFIHRISSNLCNDSYALVSYLKNKLKNIRNAVSSKLVERRFASAATSVRGPKHVKEDNVSQLDVNASDSDICTVTQVAGPIQQVNENVIDSRADSKTDVAGETQKSVPDDSCLANMQKSYKEITEFLAAITEGNIIFPDAIFTSSQIIGLCNLVQERNSCQCINEELREFLSKITFWAQQFDVSRPFSHDPAGHPLSVDETGDH